MVAVQDWGDRRAVTGISVVNKAGPGEGGSVRSGSVLTHFPAHLPPSYTVNN